MPVVYVDTDTGANGYVARIGFTEVNLSGEIRISPPFQPGECIDRYFGAVPVAVGHMATTEQATCLAFESDEAAGDPVTAQTTMGALESATRDLLEQLNRTEREQEFHDHWTGNRLT